MLAWRRTASSAPGCVKPATDGQTPDRYIYAHRILCGRRQKRNKWTLCMLQVPPWHALRRRVPLYCVSARRQLVDSSADMLAWVLGPLAVLLYRLYSKNYSTLSRSGGVLWICDERVCLPIYVSVREHFFRNTRPIFTKCFVYDRGSVLLWRRCDML